MIRWRILAFSFPLLLLAACAAKNEQAADGKKDDADKQNAAAPRGPTPPMSLYLPIPLGVPGVDDPATGVYVPADYRAGQTIDLILFLRGYDIKRPKAATSVAEYWDSPQHPVLKSFQLREEVDRSGKNVILAVPALGPFAEAGKLQEAGGVQAFLDGILDGLWRSGPHAGL